MQAQRLKKTWAFMFIVERCQAGTNTECSDLFVPYTPFL